MLVVPVELAGIAGDELKGAKRQLGAMMACRATPHKALDVVVGAVIPPAKYRMVTNWDGHYWTLFPPRIWKVCARCLAQHKEVSPKST